MKIVLAKELRNKTSLHEIPNDMPGWYRWWAPKETIESLLNSPYIHNQYLEGILPYLTVKEINGRNYYYIYTGIAVKESICSRLNWHINQHHRKSSVESGFLSTFRQSISSLIAGNQYDEVSTNSLIDTLLVEYFPLNIPVKSLEAKLEIEQIEKQEIAKNVLPLNLRDNKNENIQSFLLELKQIRKKSKYREL